MKKDIVSKRQSASEMEQSSQQTSVYEVETRRVHSDTMTIQRSLSREERKHSIDWLAFIVVR